MDQIREFLTEVDARWKPLGGEPLALQVLGSAALMLQTEYVRGTKDGDVLESRSMSEAVKAQLLTLAGKESEIHKRLRMYIDVVKPAILFLPQQPLFHPLAGLSAKNFTFEVMDVVDVVLSKLKRFNTDDVGDIRAMAARELIDHKRLVARFEAAVDWFSMDARLAEVPRYLRNLHRVESEILDVPQSVIDIPEWG